MPAPTVASVAAVPAAKPAASAKPVSPEAAVVAPPAAAPQPAAAPAPPAAPADGGKIAPGMTPEIQPVGKFVKKKFLWPGDDRDSKDGSSG
jgi:hypothetical protein